ncbi:unnamed protein product [Adineta ricciae]|uniref:Peptidase S1 domain-containing protein n=1 Tax=Adineta ricciae TaxID=249248 RepID=A0A814RFT7_ADIRI|nr:unnamed protein product [Adineta ricciae]CAF1131732.1 unnamed protein product [Adineta ricciae]
MTLSNTVMEHTGTILLLLFVCNVNLAFSLIYRCNGTAGCGCSKANVHASKIIGGEEAFPGSWGWAVSIHSSDVGHFCTGTIVSPRHVITAAHCLTDKDLTQKAFVVVGVNRWSDYESTSAQFSRLENIFSHPDFHAETQMHDIGVLRLSKPLNITNETTLARLCIPSVEPVSEYARYPGDGASLVAIGWGKLKQSDEKVPERLHQVTVNAVPVHDERCTEFIKNSTTQFCAGVDGGGKDTCQGDSGGPLMRFDPKEKRWLLAGVTSFGIGCGDRRYSGVYTRVTAYREWLKSIVDDGFIEVLTDPYSAATKNSYQIYISFLLIVELFLLS